MSQIEFAACRICNQYVDPSTLLELFDAYTDIVKQIKKVIGVELVNSPGMPSAICYQCNTDLETAQEFQRRCIESNEYFESKCEQNPLELDTVVKDEENSLLVAKSENASDFSEQEHLDEESGNKDFTENESSEQNQDDEDEVSPKKRKYKARLCSPKRKCKKKSIIMCDICGNCYKARNVFALHLRRHSKNKPYGCELCSSRFYTNSELKRHMRRHTGEKPYECQYCHRKFSDYGTHIKHERTHTNDRPFSCNQCDKSFSCNFVLKNHMLTHTGERAFKCEVCDKSFGRLHNLTTHMKSIYHRRNIIKKEKNEEVAFL